MAKQSRKDIEAQLRLCKLMLPSGVDDDVVFVNLSVRDETFVLQLLKEVLGQTGYLYESDTRLLAIMNETRLLAIARYPHLESILTSTAT